MTKLNTDYLAKAKLPRDKQRPKSAFRAIDKTHEGSFALYHFLSSGMRNRSKLLDLFHAFNCYVGEKDFSLSSYQFNAMFLDLGEAAIRLFNAIHDKRKNNRGRIIRYWAPICAEYPFSPQD